MYFSVTEFSKDIRVYMRQLPLLRFILKSLLVLNEKSCAVCLCVLQAVASPGVLGHVCHIVLFTSVNVDVRLPPRPRSSLSLSVSSVEKLSCRGA